MRVLVAYEVSGVVRDAFIAAGHDAMSCDLSPTTSPGPHHTGHMWDLWATGQTWDLVVAHPPCTYLCNSGVRWLHTRPERWALMEDAAWTFRMALEDPPAPRVCVENPVMHRYAREIVGERPTQTIQPWQFGEDASKRTGLWLRNLPPLVATDVLIRDRYANQTPSGQNRLGPSPTRAAERARTYPGIAAAMAEQWGGVNGAP